MSERIVILGGGLAGQRCAETLRRSGHEGEVVMVCGEPHRPYDRPPLSKDALLDADEQQDLYFRPAGWYEDRQVRLRLGVAARALDCDERTVLLSDGSRLSYDQLLIATGSRPRRLAQFEGYRNVTTLRTLEDAGRLRAAMRPGARLLVIGAGFVGQEVASAAVKRGVRTTIVEAAAAPLIGVLGAEVASWLAGLHAASGVQLYLEQHVSSVQGDAYVRSVTLSGGATVACDHVLLGVGVEPNLGWLRGTPLDIAGIPTDVNGCSEVPRVYAAGDAAAPFDPLVQEHVGSGHWESAGRQGARAAKAMLGIYPGPPAAASFWSDLHGVRLQYLGHAPEADAVVLEGSLDTGDFSAVFSRQHETVGVLLANRPYALPHARELLKTTIERRSG
jgi:NADPH-dependent 2,4-dienoyl-CoA reductase/sulfur reductase-like enzyme